MFTSIPLNKYDFCLSKLLHPKTNSYLIDSHGRIIKNARISITDRCNLRCKYCIPEENPNWVKKEELLSFEEIIRIVEILNKHGVNKFRLTGGEPTIRTGFLDLCKNIKQIDPKIELSITTNGIKLFEYAETMKDVGIDRINISLDTLDKDTFYKITSRNLFDDVIKGIHKAIEVEFNSIKINAVAMNGVNTDLNTLNEFINLSASTGLEIRYIEFMPFHGNNWMDEKSNGYISSNDLVNKLQAHYTLEKLHEQNPSQTSRNYVIKENSAKIGFISSVSQSFCDKCDRIRITADGFLRPCLHEHKEYDLKTKLRNGATDDDLKNLIQSGLNKKWKEHPDFLSMTYLPLIEDREMIRIGG
ncbi:MAG: GTP 3',8-cyclase MoaA [Candidatus Heimdallarchaeota archaeon]|nr:GTP 3',8-cyclase MoaA [Candidatus Heimdallarchaeota archaeon]